MATRAEIVAELKSREPSLNIGRYSNISDAPVQSAGAVEGAGGRAIRMAVGGVSELGGLVADPIGDIVEYATGYDVAPAKESALNLFDKATGSRFTPQTEGEQIAQTAGEFLTSGGAMGKAAKLAGAAPAAVKALTMQTAPEVVGALSGGAAMEAAQQAEMSPLATAGVSLAASMFPIAAAGAGRRMLPKTAKDVVDAQLNSGGKLTVGGVLGGEVMPRIESGLAQASMVGSPMRTARYAVAQALDDRLDDIAGSISKEGLEGLDEAGLFIQNKIASSMSGKIGKVVAKYDAVFDKIPVDILTPSPTSSKVLADARHLNRFNPKALSILDDPLLDNLTSGKIPARELKKMRPQVKQLADRAKNSEGMADLSKDIMKVYHGINDDIKMVAAKYVDGAEDSITKIDTEFKAVLDLDDRLSRWVGSRAREDIATSFKKLGGTGTAKTAGGAKIEVLEDIAKALPNDELKDLSSYLLRTMGRNKEGVLNPVSFVDEYAGMNSKARKIMFGKTLGAEKMKALERITKYAQSSKTTLNPSGTAAQSLDITTLGAAAYGLAASPQTLALASVPYLLSKGLASQSLAKSINRLPRAALQKQVGAYTRMELIGLLMQGGAKKTEAQDMTDELLGDKSLEQDYDKKNLIRQELLRRGVTLDTNNSIMGGDTNRSRVNSEGVESYQVPIDTDIDAIGFDEQSSLMPDITKQNEGLRYSAYKDTEGFTTVGRGFNMQSGIARNVWNQAGVETPFDDVINGRADISPQEAEALYNASGQIAINDAVALFPDIADYSQARQEAILDLSYQLGKPALSKFKATIAAAKQGKWRTAANYLLKSDYAKQTPERARLVARAFING